MTAQRKPDLPEHLRNEMARLVRSGFPLLPLGGGADGKAPLLRAWVGPVLPLARVLAPLYRAGAQAYGIRLEGLAVIDCDNDDPELVAAMETRFGPSPVHVKTPRGWHLYYLLSGTPPNLRAEGLSVDIKSGPRAYVVGPLSERPDGGRYAYVKGRLGVDRLPPLQSSQGPVAAPAVVGERHNRLKKEGRAMVEFVDNLDELVSNLCAFRDDCLPDPQSVPDSEVKGVASYFWNLRLEGRLSKGRDSEFSLHRATLDALADARNRSEAVALFVTLQDLHGHSPGKRFPLVWKAMKAAGRTDLSRARFDAARRTLCERGLIARVGKHRAGSRPQTFVLQRLRPGQSDAENVSPIKPSADRGKQGRGAITTYVHRLAATKEGADDGK